MRLARRCTEALAQMYGFGAVAVQNASVDCVLPPLNWVRQLTASIGFRSTLMPTRDRSDWIFCAISWKEVLKYGVLG